MRSGSPITACALDRAEAVTGRSLADRRPAELWLALQTRDGRPATTESPAPD